MDAETPLPSHRAHSALAQHLGLRPGDALIVVDVQRDLLPGGNLAIPAGDEVVAPLNTYLAAFAGRALPVFLTRDWHPHNHCSFWSAGGCWPPHCIRNTRGAQWAPTLNIVPGTHVVSKGMDSTAEAYSGFSGTDLLTRLQGLQVNRLFVGGLATDYCIFATVLDALAEEFEVVVLADAVRGVNAEPGDEMRAITQMLARGATLSAPFTASRTRAHATRSRQPCTSRPAYSKRGGENRVERD